MQAESTALSAIVSSLPSPVALLEGMFAHSPMPYILFEASGHPVVANAAYRAMFGGEPPPTYNVFRDEVSSRLGLGEAIQRAFRGEVIHTPTFWYDPRELRHVTVMDAKRVAIACTFIPVCGAGGEVTHVAVAFKDMTAELEARERADAERDQRHSVVQHKDQLAQALQQSEERLRDLLDAAEVGTWEWRIPENHVEWSSNIERIFGMPPGGFAGTYEAWLALVHPDDRERVVRRVSEALEARGSYETEFRFQRPDGSTGWQSTRGHVVVDELGQPMLLRGIVMDVTGRRTVEDAFEMQARILENMTEGVSVSDERGVIRYTNPAEDRMFGYGRGELWGQHVTIQNAYPPAENELIVARVIDKLKADGEWSGEWLNRRKDGTTFTTRSRITAIELDGKPHWVCVQEDVTDEVMARARADSLAAALRLSEARYRSFVGQSTEGIWRCELETPVPADLPADQQVEAFFRFAYIAESNDAMARMYGYERADAMVGKRLPELLVQEDPRNIEYLCAFVQSGYRLENAESHEIDRDGKRRVFQNSLVGVVEDGAVVRAWGTQRDITEQFEARALAEAASVAKDEFLAMLGHELRNPLSPILTALEIMRLRRSDMFQNERAIIERQVKHVVRLVDDLLDISRITRGNVSLDQRPVDLADSVTRAVELAAPLIERRAHRLSVEVPRGLTVLGDLTRLNQVFTNLLINAAKYTPTGGHITVIGDSDGTKARIRVRDTGIGIRPEILPRIFDMFVQERQSIERSEGGLGLGLSIVRSLVKLHGGTVEARSDGPGRGTELTVCLPLVARTQEAPTAPPEPASVVRKDAQRILVVDDNSDAAELLTEALTYLGHEVQVAHDGPSALRLLEAFKPSVAFLDIGLPVMDGYELARQIRAQPRLAGLRLVAVTGYGQEKDRAEARAAGFDEHLVKPVDLGALERSMSKAGGR